MLQYPKKSKQRSEIIQQIRKQGNFQEYLRGTVRPTYQSKNRQGEYVPCASCKGLYSKQYLYRHHKVCRAVKITKDPGTIKHLSASQTLIACSLDTSNTINRLRVKEEVFNKMAADEISLVAKTDIVIVLYGEQYLKMHKREQLKVVCSQKMREMARFLIQIRKIENNDKFPFIDVLTPSMFEKVLDATKRVAGFDIETNSYRSPSLPPHIGTALKQISELVIAMLLRNPSMFNCQTPDIKIKEVKTFLSLINSQWTSEISSLAMRDLNEKKWKKPPILPLTRDVLKFKDYVISVADIAAGYLQLNLNDAKQYKNLVNATLTLTILFNRRRIGDVQFTELNSYYSSYSTSNQEELVKTLSPSEKQLTKHYKRVVTGGKGTKPIVILFPRKLQDYMDMILKVRQNTNLVLEKNKYLFAHPNSAQWIRADSIIRQFANKCGIQNPSHISSNKLRKQIATVMQLISLTKDETKHFAEFMGHNEKTHNQFYELPQDIYQTAKVSKLLILMDQGGGEQYKGKSLSEIEINPETEEAVCDESDDDDEVIRDTGNSVENVVLNFQQPSSTIKNKSPVPNGRWKWTKQQRQLIIKHFKNHIKQRKPPKIDECMEFKNKHPSLFGDMYWKKIKAYVYNEYKLK
ncbi:uncharacterized protein LOC123268918 [Cotesia glomerata]|uniref:uncharacterized protein LOC123268918 n=1 Tax=Cotesia glomerata TaxID=32391 RepID=UPI001D021B38|nr:uncharacterized protein LOC123268918 [Cotesia glomerata]